jgi:hypothetical protein
MKIKRVGALVAAVMLCASMGVAEAVTLTPADPQPGKLKEGLSVMYGYPGGKVRSLSDASSALKKSKKGKPLAGLNYKDTNEGDLVLTSRREYQVAAAINGYVHFDAPGAYDIDFLTNDGLEVTLGGQPVAKYDGIHACSSTRVTNVTVPEAGWYALEMTYFQKEGTSCLQMRMAPEGSKVKQVADSAFGYKK